MTDTEYSDRFSWIRTDDIRIDINAPLRAMAPTARQERSLHHSDRDSSE
ncbi:hypothetical protein [Nostoc sp.]